MKFIAIFFAMTISSAASSKHHMDKMNPEMKQAVKSCHEEAKFEKGKRPTKEARKAFKECMKNKGVDIKERSHHKMKKKTKQY